LLAFTRGFWLSDITSGGLDPTGIVGHDLRCFGFLFFFRASCIECAILFELTSSSARQVMCIELILLMLPEVEGMWAPSCPPSHFLSPLPRFLTSPDVDPPASKLAVLLPFDAGDAEA
jgi:hypothetical protein